MLGMGHLWPPVSQWLDPAIDDRLIATAVAIVEQQEEETDDG